MRILEKCTSSWPMPDMQQQIDALREAFSADVRKPFVLKPSFPYGSPSSSVTTSPPRRNSHYHHTSSQSSSRHNMEHIPQQVSYANHHPISPPVSAGRVDTKSDSPPVQLMASGQRSQLAMPAGVPMGDTPTWNPSRIFEYVGFRVFSGKSRLTLIVNGIRLLVRHLHKAIPLQSQPL